MSLTPQSINAGSVTMLTLLREVRVQCENERVRSLEAVRRQFSELVRNCCRPTAPSNPSMSFFADWLARKCKLTISVAGKWQMLSLDYWQVISESEPNDALAYSKFWELFDEYCQLDERIVCSLRCNDTSSNTRDGKLLRCELIQLYPESGVYLRSYRADSASILGVRILNFGFFDSEAIANAFVKTSHELNVSDWVLPTEL
jgi:hypothetical protein